MSEERDIVTFTDDEGHEIDLEVLDYFFYNGQEYAVLVDADEDDCECGCCGHDHAEDAEHEHKRGEDCDCKEHEHGDDCDCEDERELYIMKVVQLEGDMEEFQPVEEELLEKLSEIVSQRFEEDDDEDEDE